MSLQHQSQKRLKNQRIAAAVSLGSVIVISLLFNQFLASNESRLDAGAADQSNRFIASLPENQNPQSLSWELRMAEELNSPGLKMMAAEQPKISDQLLFGELRGQYAAVLNDNFKITKLQLIGDGQEQIIENFDQFLIAKRNLFSINYDQVKMVSDVGPVIHYQLSLGSVEVGKATIEKNAFGHLKTLEIHRN